MRLLLSIAVTMSIGLCLLQTDSAVAQHKPYGVFVGRIVDANGNTIRGASVTVEGVDYTRAVKPNPAGYFGIELPVGVYTITVNRSGFAAYKLTNVNISAGGSVHYVFRLERPNRQSRIQSARSIAFGDA
jgi:hypothetical protein